MFSRSRSPPAVAASADSIDVRVAGGSSSSRPRSRTWTPCARSSAVSLRIACSRSPNSPTTSSSVRAQFSRLNAYSVRTGMPRPDRVPEQLADRLDAGGVALELRGAAGAGPAAVAVHDDRDVARPVACAPRRRARSAARRCGRRLRRARSRAREAGRRSGGSAAHAPLDLEDLLLLRGADAVDLADVAVRGPLERPRGAGGSRRCRPRRPSRAS